MAITIAAKYDFDIPAQAEALKIPPNVLKLIIQKLFGMQGWRLIPDNISFIEISKAFTAIAETGLAVNHQGPLLINGVDTVVIGVREGQGTDTESTLAYLCKAAKVVFDLSPWAATMDERLK